MGESGERTGLPGFDRRFLESHEDFTVIGTGALGGKAEGLAALKRQLGARWPAAAHPQFEACVPRLTVLATDVFERFMDENALWGLVGAADDERLAHAFLRASLPAGVVGDLRGLVEGVRQPLAVRSSSLLEDAADEPRAGAYVTKMLPNHQLDAEGRFRALVEAVKLVWASTWFAAARAGLDLQAYRARERMAVVIQEVVGRRHGERFYPDVSGVARSWNFWAAGGARPEDGVASLALGLGRTIVEGGAAWHYSPARPRARPAAGRDLLRSTQTRFWAVHMGAPPPWNPLSEAEWLVQAGLPEAEQDGVLDALASTWDPQAERLRPGTAAAGPRVLDFAPLLELERPPLNAALQELLRVGEAVQGGPAEVEFALTLDPARAPPARLGFLQLRPVETAGAAVSLSEADLRAPDLLVACEGVLGRSARAELHDVVWLRPAAFDLAHARRMAEEVGALGAQLAAQGRPWLLLGAGRWGSADPWLGVPVRWEQVAGARAVVEVALGEGGPEPSQGSHFFHNLVSRGAAWFSVGPGGAGFVDWDWLEAQPAQAGSERVRHVSTRAPLRLEVDGRAGRGVVRRAPDAPGRDGA